MGTRIELPFGGRGAGFDTDDLISHIRNSGRSYIIQGHEKVAFDKLKKNKDWMRGCGRTIRTEKTLCRLSLKWLHNWKGQACSGKVDSLVLKVVGV